jgi:NAD(P)-dependent dehydrogenase (short-subunit alcohol dehydrogenase family)
MVDKLVLVCFTIKSNQLVIYNLIYIQVPSIKEINNGGQNIVKNKIVLITGATNGIGKAAARELAKQGATVVIVRRDKIKTEAVTNELRSNPGNSNVEYLLADLSSQASIRQLAEDFKARHSRLDVLINNAGGIFDTRETTVDGLEYTFAFNHLAYFLLTNLLLDVLKASSPSRIINVSSTAQGLARLDFDDLQSTKRYEGFSVYAKSKLANVMFTYELAKRLQGTGVSVNAVHPGRVNTAFAESSRTLFIRLSMALSKWLLGISPEQGADTLVYLATSPEVEGVSSRYFARRKPRRTNPRSYDEAANQRLWEESANLVKLTI